MGYNWIAVYIGCIEEGVAKGASLSPSSRQTIYTEIQHAITFLEKWINFISRFVLILFMILNLWNRCNSCIRLTKILHQFHSISSKKISSVFYHILLIQEKHRCFVDWRIGFSQRKYNNANQKKRFMDRDPYIVKCVRTRDQFRWGMKSIRDLLRMHWSKQYLMFSEWKMEKNI